VATSTIARRRITDDRLTMTAWGIGMLPTLLRHGDAPVDPGSAVGQRNRTTLVVNAARRLAELDEDAFGCLLQ
jgi:hypothetical protein